MTVLKIINSLFPFLYTSKHLFKNFNYPKGIINFIGDFNKYRKIHALNGQHSFPLTIKDLFPFLFDRYDEAGSAPKHYFYQDMWAAKKVLSKNTEFHYDIGSRLDGFISSCLLFTKVTMLDIRPLDLNVKNLNFIETNAMNMQNIESNTIQSISSLHAIEHFGLGRYGDPINPNGYIEAINEIQRITSSEGTIIFSVPIGLERLEFNAHRVFNPNTIINLFNQCELLELSIIDDDENFIENIDLNQMGMYENLNYGCGLFHFKKN